VGATAVYYMMTQRRTRVNKKNSHAAKSAAAKGK